MRQKSKKSERPIARLGSESKTGLNLVAATKKLGGLGPSEARTDPRWVELGERIRAARLARGWTQSVLARKAKWAQSDLSDLERGQVGPQGPSLRTLTSIADALGIELPIVPEGGDNVPSAELFGEVHRALTDYTTANALFTSAHWDRFREYVAEYVADHVSPVRAADLLVNRCVVWTLGYDAMIDNLRAHTSYLVTVMRGAGDFKFFSPVPNPSHALSRVTGIPGMFNTDSFHTITDGGEIAGILDADACLQVRATEMNGLTMMLVPVDVFVSHEQGDSIDS